MSSPRRRRSCARSRCASSCSTPRGSRSTSGSRRLLAAATRRGTPRAERARQILHGITNEGALELVRAHGALDFPPGTQYRYSNSGYVLLALVAARAAGQPFPVFLRQHLFAPAGMHRTLVYDELCPPVPHQARAYRHGPDGYAPETVRGDYELHTVGDGGLFSTVGDLFRFDRALDGERVLSRPRAGRDAPAGPPLGRPPDQAAPSATPSARLARRRGAPGVVPAAPRLALPRVRFALRRRRFAYHPGGAGAYRAHFWRFPKARDALVVLSADGGLDVDASVRPLLDLLLAGRAPPPAA